ncbi:hypothetical protein ACISMU_07660 [Campylobacter jejuni]
MINPFKSKKIATGSLSGRKVINQRIKSSHANVCTSFYKARDIEVETAVVNRGNDIFKKNDNK